MIIERTKKEVIIKLAADVPTEDLQDFVNYARYKELTRGFKSEQEKVNRLSRSINNNWWKKNRKKFVK
ncbi:MAG: hypothetical protein JSS63_07965 [Bacteroidetes bacterium]|nr:hypothetical protein [Bacteroidota bacterium]